MIEKREDERYVVEGMGIYAKTMFNTVVEILELGASGALISGAQRFFIGCEYIFKIEHGDKVIPIKGVIVWKKITMTKTTEGVMNPIYTAGLEFLDVLTVNAEHLKALISDKVQELKERWLSGVRVKVQPPEKAVISYIETCVIKDISLNGIRIELEQEPPVDIIFTLELTLTRNESSIGCKGRIAFCHEVPETMPKRYDIGVELTDVLDSDQSRLRRFIETIS